LGFVENINDLMIFKIKRLKNGMSINGGQHVATSEVLPNIQKQRLRQE